MAATKNPQRAVVFDEPSVFEEDPAAYGSGDQTGTDEATDTSLCPACGEPLTWHEEACPQPSAAPAPEAAATMSVLRPAAASTYAYDVGLLVQPATQTQAHPIVWRGQLKERHPATGLVHRVNVYRLNDGYWDCYREEELQVA
jgi:hypothetical protein